MRPTACIGGVFLILTLTWELSGRDDQPKKFAAPSDTKESVMRRKLGEAQKLLEGLALNDFNKIKSASDELANLRKKAAWPILKTRDYDVYSNEFEREIEALQKAAKNKNIDGATLAYVNMTLTCVRCHEHVREEGVALLPVPSDDRQFARRSD